MNPGHPSATANLALLLPFISLSPGSGWVSGKSGAAFLIDKQNKQCSGEKGSLAGPIWLLSSAPVPGCGLLSPGTPFFCQGGGLQSHCRPAGLTGQAPFAVGVRLSLLEWLLPSFLSVGWAGSFEGKPAGGQVAEKDAGSRGSSRESKQTGLCVATDLSPKGSRPVAGGGEAGGSAGPEMGS